jgi:hypothetical protein
LKDFALSFGHGLCALERSAARIGQRFDIFSLAGHDRIDINAGQSVVSQFAREFFRELLWIKEGFDRFRHSIPPQYLVE